ARVVEATDLCALESVQNDADVRYDIVAVHRSISLEWRESTGYSFATGLMTRRAVGRVQCTTLRCIVAAGRGLHGRGRGRGLVSRDAGAAGNSNGVRQGRLLQRCHVGDQRRGFPRGY